MSSDDLEPGTRFLDYRIQGLLGEGGMGRAYEAVEEFSENVVAIKLLRGRYTGREDFVLRLKQESKFYSLLRHPNIVRMLRAGLSDDGLVFIVMERLRGKTLWRILHQLPGSRLDFLNALHVMLQVADALGAAHRAGIWHRDLKPENVMIGTRGDDKGHVWVLDFGIAKAERGPSTDHLPRLGTGRYMSPEQVRNERADARADIYAFGVVFYEMLTGSHIFIEDGDEPPLEQVLGGHLFAAPPKPIYEIVPDCPEAIWPIVARCLEKDRDRRYPTMEEVVNDLRELVRQSIPVQHPLALRIAEEKLKTKRKAAFEAVPAAIEIETETDERTAWLPEAATTEGSRAATDDRMTQPGVWTASRGFRAVAAEPVAEPATEQRLTAPLAAGFTALSPHAALPLRPASARELFGKGHTVRLPAGSPIPDPGSPSARLARLDPPRSTPMTAVADSHATPNVATSRAIVTRRSWALPIALVAALIALAAVVMPARTTSQGAGVIAASAIAATEASPPLPAPSAAVAAPVASSSVPAAMASATGSPVALGRTPAPRAKPAPTRAVIVE